MIELVKMWVLVEALGMLALPVAVTVFHRLADRGWAFSKALGLTLFAFAVWFPLASVPALPYSQPVIWGIGVLFLVGCLAGFWRTRHTLGTLVRGQWVYVLLTEGLFTGMVALLGLLRQFRPDLRSSENFMDEGIIATIMRSPHLPPSDVWFSGASINYYYYTHFLAATLGKMIGQAPSVLLNTMLCILFGLVATNLFGLTCNIVAWARQTRLQRQTVSQSGVPSVSSPSRQRSLLLPVVPFGFFSVLIGLLLGNLAGASLWWSILHDRTAVLYHLPYNMPPTYPYPWFYPAHVIPNTINEFPAYSFLLADYHSQITTLAFTLLAMGVAFNLVLANEPGALRLFGSAWRLPCTLVVSALCLGQLFVMGGWEFPAFLLIALLAVILQQWLAHGSRFSLRWLRDAGFAVLLLGGLSMALFAPFYLTYSAPTQGLGLVSPQLRADSSLVNEAGIYGLFAFLFVSLLVVCFWSPRPLLFRRASSRRVSISPLSEPEEASVQSVSSALSSLSPASPSGALPLPAPSALLASDEEQETMAQAPGIWWRDPRVLGLLGTLVVALLLLVLLKNSATLVLAGGLAVMAGIMTVFHRQDRARAFVLLLGTVALALIALCEVVYLKDAYQSPYLRMTTVFKFYYQAWILFSVACGSGLFFLREALWPVRQAGTSRSQRTSQPRKVSGWARRGLVLAWSLGLLALVGLASVYPVVAPSARLLTLNPETGEMTLTPGWSLDGMTFLQQCQPPDIYPDTDTDVPYCIYDVTADYAALTWINAYISGDPILVEAAIDDNDYSLYGRVSSFTGLPTIMGKPGHERTWRGPASKASINQRLKDIETIYTDPDPQVVLRLMRQYHAQYLFVGAMERVTYPKADLTRFAPFLRTVYNAGGVAIYQFLH